MFFFNIFFMELEDTSCGIVIDLVSNYIMVLFLRSCFPFHIDVNDSYMFCCHNIRYNLYQHTNSRDNLFVDNFRSCFSCNQYRFRILHLHNFGIVFVQTIILDLTFWNNNTKLRDCHYLPDVVDLFYYSQSHNSTLLDRHLLRRERL